MQTLTEFQVDLLYQLSAGPAPAVVLQDNEELTRLVAIGLVALHPIPDKKVNIVFLTDAGFNFCLDVVGGGAAN